ncbi:MAG: hypothetical protein ACTSR1_00305 [Candidatus Heimdallarchaeota archaeon]
MGRPVYYATDEELEHILGMFREGAYISEIATYFNITRVGLWERSKRDERLFNTIKKGKDFSLSWHEARGREGIFNKDFNASTWFMIMRNKHGWHNKQFEEKNDTGAKLKGDTAIAKIKDLSNKVSDHKISLTAAKKQLSILEAELAGEAQETLNALKKSIDMYSK